jgi:hypothetical protein
MKSPGRNRPTGTLDRERSAKSLQMRRANAGHLCTSLPWGEDPYLLPERALELVGDRKPTEVDVNEWRGSELRDLATPSLFGEPRALIVTDVRTLPEGSAGRARRVRWLVRTPTLISITRCGSTGLTNMDLPRSDQLGWSGTSARVHPSHAPEGIRTRPAGVMCLGEFRYAIRATCIGRLHLFRLGA